MTQVLAGSFPLFVNPVDTVCHAPERNRCLDRARFLCAQAHRHEYSLAAIWIDLDRFDMVNRSFGHRGGDQVIGEITRRLHKALGSRQEWFRVGADEFVVLATKLSQAEVEALANRLRELVDLPIVLGQISLHPTASIGIAELDRGEGPAALLERADRAMLEAKQSGGNRWLFSGEERVPGLLGALLAREELEIEADMHAALANDGLSLVYQPTVHLDGRTEAVEALTRCRVNGREVSPSRLIPVAEKTGMVSRLGEWSLSTAAQFARELRVRGHDFKVAVNVSRAQLLSPDFASTVMAALLSACVEPGRLELELTESLFLDLSAVVSRNIATCVELGIPLAIDDFGTGYSCLASIKDLPAGKLKLDREFIKVLPADKRAYSVVKMISALGRELGMTVVAEGVETQAQWECLQAAGIDATQGWLHAQPMAGTVLLDWLQGKQT